MKRGWVVLLAALVIALGAIVWEFRRTVPFLIMFAMEPAGHGCDEGPLTDSGATNSRGDLVEKYIKACTGFGTVVDYSIVLQLRGDQKTRTLVEHDRLYYQYPKFRWINDDLLNIDLGEVSWVSLKTDRVGSIRITYLYTKAAISWW